MARYQLSANVFSGGLRYSILRYSNSHKSKLEYLPCRRIQTENSNEEQSEVNYQDSVLEEEIEKKRNKNRLPPFIHKVFYLKEKPELYLKFNFTKKYLRKYYGTYGQESGLNPGIMWPTKEEFKDLKHFEDKYYPPLNEMIEKVLAEKEELEIKKKAYENEVNKNLANYDKVLKDYYGKIAKKEAAAEELSKKRELLVDEISEYLGYEVDPRDPRFQEAVERRTLEKKKAQKQQKEKESYQKMLQKLSEIAKDPFSVK